MTRDEEIKYLQTWVRTCEENIQEARLSKCRSAEGWQRELDKAKAKLAELKQCAG